MQDDTSPPPATAPHTSGSPQAAAPAPRSRAIAHLLDNSIRIPGTNRRIGLDPLLGFVPVAGDAISNAFGLSILYDAARFRVGAATMLRMAANLLANSILGSVPLVGDLFSAAFKSNARNYHLLADHLQKHDAAYDAGPVARPGIPWLALALIAAVALVAIAALIGVGYVVVRLIG